MASVGGEPTTVQPPADFKEIELPHLRTGETGKMWLIPETTSQYALPVEEIKLVLADLTKLKEQLTCCGKWQLCYTLLTCWCMLLPLCMCGCCESVQLKGQIRRRLTAANEELAARDASYRWSFTWDSCHCAPEAVMMEIKIAVRAGAAAGAAAPAKPFSPVMTSGVEMDKVR